MLRRLEELEEKIHYTFKNKMLITTALTHSSYKNEQKNVSHDNERLEFLGDAVLSIIVADYIFKHKKVAEGELTKIRASLVCESSSCTVCRNYQFRLLPPFRKGRRAQRRKRKTLHRI